MCGDFVISVGYGCGVLVRRDGAVVAVSRRGSALGVVARGTKVPRASYGGLKRHRQQKQQKDKATYYSHSHRLADTGNQRPADLGLRVLVPLSQIQPRSKLPSSGVMQAKGGGLQQKVGSSYDPDGSFSICFNHRMARSP